MMNRRDERYGYEQHGFRDVEGRDDWRERDERQRDLSGRDLSGRDFSGRDFSGRDFSGRDFSGRDFSGRDRTWGEEQPGGGDEVGRRMRMNESMRNAMYGYPQSGQQSQSYGRDQDMERGWARETWRGESGQLGRYSERAEGFEPRQGYQGVIGPRVGSSWGSDYQGTRGSPERIGSGQGMMGQRFGGGYGFGGTSSYGVHGHRGKGPRGFRRSDERLREQVCEVLSDHDEIDASEMDVTVKDGEVILSGTVEERRMKYLAEQAADSVPGVIEVQNNLRVRRVQESSTSTTGDRTARTTGTTTTTTQQPRGAH